MQFSYWEHNTWLRNIDFAIVGSGIVGLSCALSLREKFPNAKIVVFERGMLPSGASTKNAGFACFGSVSELLGDLKILPEEEVVELVRSRAHGLDLLRRTIGDAGMDYKAFGGYELFLNREPELYEECIAARAYINSLTQEIFGGPVFTEQQNPNGFGEIFDTVLFNKFEGQIDTGKMMASLLKKAVNSGILILNGAEVTLLESLNKGIAIELNRQIEISSRHVMVATNGFARRLLDLDVNPARAQVLVTEPIDDLKIKGTFHLDRGYYYFRNIHNRILLGGGRNLDLRGESTDSLETTDMIQNALYDLLHTTILPDTAFTIDTRWSGILGLGGTKKPLVKQVEPHIYCGVRMGGMGVAIGSAIGLRLADLVESE